CVERPNRWSTPLPSAQRNGRGRNKTEACIRERPESCPIHRDSRRRACRCADRRKRLHGLVARTNRPFRLWYSEAGPIASALLQGGASPHHQGGPESLTNQ